MYFAGILLSKINVIPARVKIAATAIPQSLKYDIIPAININDVINITEFLFCNAEFMYSLIIPTNGLYHGF